nr:putative inactive purple acid phosphatase 1 [Quercus suber]
MRHLMFCKLICELGSHQIMYLFRAKASGGVKQAAPARTVGWLNPGYIRTSFLKELWPNKGYTYKLGHRLFNGTCIWSQEYWFRASPYPGQNSLQRVIIFGDMGKLMVPLNLKISSLHL